MFAAILTLALAANPATDLDALQGTWRMCRMRNYGHFLDKKWCANSPQSDA